jgi:hypothetical protein
MKHPPTWARRLLRALLDPRNRDSIDGDLLEEYNERGAATAWYLRQVLSFVNARSLARAPFASNPAIAQDWRPESQLVFRVAALWFMPLAVAAFAVFHSQLAPVSGVRLLFVCVAGAALHAAGRTGKAGLGIAASVATGLLTTGLMAGIFAAFDFPHPPIARAIFAVPCISAMLGAVAAPFARRFAAPSRHQRLGLDARI